MNNTKSAINKTIVIGGASGVGKTSVINFLIEKCAGKSNINVSQFNTGSYFQKLLSRGAGKAIERDDIRNVNWRTLEFEVANHIVSDFFQIPPLSCYLLDTHYAANSPYGYMMGLGLKCLEQIVRSIYPDNPSEEDYYAAIILIEADIAEVMERRKADIKRYREMSIIDIVRNLELSRVYSLEYYHIFADYLGSERVQYLQVLNEDTKHCSDLIFENLKAWNFV